MRRIGRGWLKLTKSDGRSAPIVSVIIPAYNAEAYVEQCLNSVCNQTLADIEVIIVDDGSTDGTLEILRRFEAADRRVTVLTQKNLFAGVARNAGMKIARGTYLLFLDADDFFEATMLEHMLTRAQTTDADVVLCRTNYLDVTTGKLAPHPHTIKHLEPGRVYTAEELRDHMFDYSIGWPWDKLFKRSLIEDESLEFCSTRSINDAFFVFMALICARRITLVDEYLANHRINDPNSIENSRHHTWENTFIAMEKIEKELRARGLFEDYELPFLRWVCHLAFWNFETLEGPSRAATLARLQRDWQDRLTVLDDDEMTPPHTRDYLNMLRMDYADLLREHIAYYWEIHWLHKTIADYEASTSYKIGRAMTTLPRVIRDGLWRGSKKKPVAGETAAESIDDEPPQ